MNKINKVYFFYRTIFGDSKTEFYNKKWLSENPNLKRWIDKRKVLQKELSLVKSEKELVFFENNWHSFIGYASKEDFVKEFSTLKKQEKVVFSETLLEKQLLTDLIEGKHFSLLTNQSVREQVNNKGSLEAGFKFYRLVVKEPVKEEEEEKEEERVVRKNNISYLIFPWQFGNDVALQKEAAKQISEIALFLDRKFDSEGVLGLNNSVGVRLDFPTDKRVQGLHFKLKKGNQLSSYIKIDISNKNWKRIFSHEWCHALEWASESDANCREAIEKVKESLSSLRPNEPNLDCVLMLKRWSRVWKEKKHFLDDLTNNLNNYNKVSFVFDSFLKSLTTEEEKSCFEKIKTEFLFLKNKSKNWKSYLEELDKVTPNKTGITEYWSSQSEMVARSFETWVHSDDLVSEDFKIPDIEMCFKNYPPYTSWVFVHKELREAVKALSCLFKSSATAGFHADQVSQPSVLNRSKKF